MKALLDPKLFQVAEPLMKAYANVINSNHLRMGGNWACAWALFRRSEREFFRDLFGDRLIIVVLNLTPVCIRKRLAMRHGDNKQAIDNFMEIIKIFEPAEKDEKDTVNLNITEDMSTSDVASKILKIIEKF